MLPSPARGQGLGGVAWGPDGRRLAVAADNTITIWDARTGAIESSLQYPAFLQRVALSPDAKRIAGGGAAGRTLVWSLASGTTLLDLDSRTTLVNGVTFSPDGRLLATTGNDGLVRLWDAQSGRERAARSGHTGGTFAVAFSPDGRRLASSSVDRTVKIWTVVDDSLAAEEPLTLAGHSAAVYRVAWSPDGRRLATASRDGTSRNYVVELDDLLALAHSRVTRSLTAEECQKYLHQADCPD